MKLNRNISTYRFDTLNRYLDRGTCASNKHPRQTVRWVAAGRECGNGAVQTQCTTRIDHLKRTWCVMGFLWVCLYIQLPLVFQIFSHYCGITVLYFDGAYFCWISIVGTPIRRIQNANEIRKTKKTYNHQIKFHQKRNLNEWHWRLISL